MDEFEKIDESKIGQLMSQGNTAEVYLYDKDRILKLFRKYLPVEAVRWEYEASKTVQKCMDNVPRVYEAVKIKERYGIIYEKIEGQSMFSAMLANAGKIKAYSRQLAELHVKMHENRSDMHRTLKSKLCMEIDMGKDLSDDEKKKVKEYLEKLPEGRAVCHFDFHPGNIIFRGEQPVIIDWMTGCNGNPVADAARTVLMMRYAKMQHVNFMVNAFVHIFEKRIGRIYQKEYCRLTGVKKEEIEQWMLPLAAARLMEWIPQSEKEKLLKMIRQKL